MCGSDGECPSYACLEHSVVSSTAARLEGHGLVEQKTTNKDMCLS